MPKEFSEILGEEAARIERILNFASGTKHPILYMELLQALNAMRYAAASAETMEKNGGEVPEGYDIHAALAQFKDFLRTLPGQDTNDVNKRRAR